MTLCNELKERHGATVHVTRKKFLDNFAQVSLSLADSLYLIYVHRLYTKVLIIWILPRIGRFLLAQRNYYFQCVYSFLLAFQNLGRYGRAIIYSEDFCLPI